MQHIETVTLSASQSSITFSAIPQDFTDLVLKVSARADGLANVGGNISLNGSSSDFTSVRLFGDGSSPGSDTPGTNILFLPGSGTTANTFSNNSVYISNYTASQNKSISTDNVMENNATTSFQTISAALWSNTAAITSLSFSPTASLNFISGTTISLYGITAGGSGTVTTT